MTQPASKPPASIATKPVEQNAVAHARMDKLAEAIDELRNIVLENHEEMRKNVSAIREDVDEMKTWRTGASDRVRQVSQSDLEQSAQLAQERLARESLAAKVDALAVVNQQQLAVLTDLRDGAQKVAGKVVVFMSHPVVKYIAAALWTLGIAWLARHGIEIPK